MATKFITIFSGYKPENRFTDQKDLVSRTIQDCVVDVISLFDQFSQNLPDLFHQYDNGLVYESATGVGVFYDELNADEVKAYQEYLAKQEALKAEQEATQKAFDEWKQFKAEQALTKRAETSALSEQKEESKSSVS